MQAYGEASQGGKGSSILEFLVAKLRINFIMWNADPDVLIQIIALLNTFGQRASVRNTLLQSEQFPPLVSFFIDHLSILPEVIHKYVFCLSCQLGDPSKTYLLVFLTLAVYSIVLSSTFSSLIQSITTIISYAPTEQLNGHYFGLISAAIETRFAAVLHDKDLMTKYQSSEVMSQIMNGLEV